MNSKKKILWIAGCFVAILAAVIILIVWKQKQPEEADPEPPEETRSATLQKLENMTHDELVAALENITDEELVDLANSPWHALSKDYRSFDTFSVPFLDGDGNPHEMWYESDFWLAGTVSSVEQARAAAQDFAEDCSVEFIGENDLYYQFRVIEGTDPYRYAHRMNFYKDSVLRLSKAALVDSYGKPHYTFKDAIFQTLDYETVLTMMDQQNRYGLYRYFEENSREYIYTQYKLAGCGGDWGLNDTVSLIKIVTRISKETGTLETTETVIKENVEIPGTAMQAWSRHRKTPTGKGRRMRGQT